MDASNTTIIYEGPGIGTELLGATQANFYVPALEREFGVLVNEPTLQYLMTELDGKDTQEWREDMARRLGELVVRRMIRDDTYDPIRFVGRRVLDDDPSLLEELKQSATA